MPLIEAKILAGRSESQIQAFIAQVTDAAVASLGVPIGNVRVIVTEVPKQQWGIGGKTAKELGR